MLIRRAAPAAALLAACCLTAPAGAAKLPACAVVEDAKGDSPDGSLDITKVTYAKVGKSLEIRLAIAALAENATTGWGDRFQANFRANDKLVEVYWKRSRTRDVEANVFYQSGLRVDGTFVSDAGISAKHDLDAGTVTITVTLAAVKAGVGKSLDGAAITEIGAVAFASFVATNQQSDIVESTKSFVVADCRA